MTSPTETEVKILVTDRETILERLKAAGFQVSRRREFEANTIYDTPDRELLKRGALLRLRQSGDKAMVTGKGPAVPGPHKSRPEVETQIGSLCTMAAILDQLGYRPSFRYEKFRTEYRSNDPRGGVVLAETPIGTFLDLEGDGDWIDWTARLLGFASEDYILESYAGLNRRHATE